MSYIRNEVTRGRLARRAIVGLAVAGLLLAACGSDSKSTSSTATTKPAAATSALLGPNQPATGSPVKIGFVTAEGGQATDLTETRKAAEAVVKYANEHLTGLAGHQIVLETCQDKGDGASATACANRFVEQKVAALVVGQVANPDLYIPILQGAGIPWVIEVAAGSREVTSDISFDLTGGLIGQLAATAVYARDHGLKHLVLFGIDVPAFTAAFKAFGQPVFDKAGVKIDVVTVPPGTPDATSQVTSGMAKDPDGVVIVADGTLCKALLPAISTANTKNVQLFFPDLCASKDVIATVGADAVQGAIVNGNSASVGNDPEGKLYKAVLGAYAPQTSPQGKAGAGYVGMLSLVRAINQVKPTGELTAAVVLEAMRTAKDVPLPGHPGGATFTCDGHAVPILKAFCSSAVLFAKLKGTTLTDFQTLDGSELLKK